MEAGLLLAGIAQPARVVVHDPYPVKKRPDVCVPGQELVEAPSQLIPRAPQQPAALASTRGGAVPLLSPDIVRDLFCRGTGPGPHCGAGHIRE